MNNQGEKKEMDRGHLLRNNHHTIEGKIEGKPGRAGIWDPDSLIWSRLR